MERMLIKHLSGSKANQVEEFALKYHNDLIFGREEGASVKYDPDRDDLVGRQHAKVSRDPSDPNGFLVEDLNSRNGTFLNKQRINGKTKIYPGDLVQLGVGGPEFQFEVEPRPQNGTKATRIAETSAFGKVSPETRVASTNVSRGGGISNSIPTAPSGTSKPPGTVGKATVERMISHTVSETKKSQGRKFGLIGTAAALAVLLLFGVVIGGAYLYNSRQQQAQLQKEQEMKAQLAQQQQEAAGKQAEIEKKMEEERANAAVDPALISEKYANTVVKIDVTWHLYDAARNTQLYHQYVPNDTRFLAAILKVAPPKVPTKINPQAGSVIPLYLAVGNTYEPLLTNVPQTGSVDNPGIGAKIYGSGFIVSNDGFVLTNRHVGASWMTVYEFNPNTTPEGIIINPDGSLAANRLVPPPPHWVPSQTKQGGRQYTGTIAGTNDSLVISFNGKENRINAQFVSNSPRHDVALLKIPLPGQVNKVELNDNYESLKRGEQVTIMGYPMASPDVVGIIKSKDVFNNEADVIGIPQVTVTNTNIANILRGSDKPGEDQTVSQFGDVIQLATNTTGHGNSGGPVFDSKGRVIGIFFAGSTIAGTSITYAVPIRFGMELLQGQ